MAPLQMAGNIWSRTGDRAPIEGRAPMQGVRLSRRFVHRTICGGERGAEENLGAQRGWR